MAPSSELRGKLIKSLPDKTVKHICDACYNILAGNCRLSSRQYETLRRYKKPIRQLGYEPYHPLNYKRKILKEQKGGFLGAVFPIIASLIGGLVGSIIKK